jgi:membrane protease YdiL (CAAX protease family)
VPEPPGGLRWVFMGPQGLRAGWSVAIFVAIFGGTATGLRLMAEYVQKMAPHAAAKGGQSQGMSPWAAASGEGIGVLFLLLVMWIMSLIERRDVLDYNLRGPRILAHFAQGVGCGFLALSALIGALTAGGWLHFAGLALSGPQIVLYAAVWGGAFLLVGCMEEGMFRCYLQFTLARGINFWWALGLVGAICGELLWRGKGNGIWGVYIIASLGLIPCAWLYLNKLAGNGFWQATWVTSTLFGFVHTGNNGENWIGIFSAAAIGAVFCVSIRLTGSAWWAIGCHAAWDWGQTYFYGVADSGLPAAGHLLNSIVPATANAFWSGGKDGPEGSVLVIPTVVLILLLLVILYARRSRAPASITIEQTAG